MFKVIKIEWNLKFSFTSDISNAQSHTWLVATVVDIQNISTEQHWYKESLPYLIIVFN